MKTTHRSLCYLAVVTVAASFLPGLGAASLTAHASQPIPFGDPAFDITWQRTDRPVALGEVQRSYFWGPQANTLPLLEPYAQGVNGQRVVQYFDKSRMEINNPYANPNDPFYVTNGLLTIELISGKMQVSDASYVDREPADIPLASDTDDPNAPTYRSFQGVSNTPLGSHPVGSEVGQFATATINKAGQVGDDPSKVSVPGTQFVYHEPLTGHNIPEAVWEFLNMSGMIYDPTTGHDQTAQLSVPWYYATGLPISEPYWAKVKIANVPNVDVMIQAFERRVVTYVPSAPDGFKVQMGNIGQHYYDWRYGSQSPTPAPTVQPQPTATTPPDQPTNTPAAATDTPIAATDTPVVPTDTPVPGASATATATATAGPQHTAADLDGTWLLDNPQPSAVKVGKLWITHNGNTLTVHAWRGCNDQDCDLGIKTKQYNGGVVELIFDTVTLRISFENQGNNKLKVMQQTDETTFRRAKASDYQGVWLNDAPGGNVAKLWIESDNGKLTVTWFEACGEHICQRDSKTKEYDAEPFEISINGNSFRIMLNDLRDSALRVVFNDTNFPHFHQVVTSSYDGTWANDPTTLKLVITNNGDTIHIHSFEGICIDQPCGPLPQHQVNITFKGEPLVMQTPDNTYRISFDSAAGTRLKVVRTNTSDPNTTFYLTKHP